MKYIVKRLGHEEDFEEKKLYKTIYNACILSDMSRVECVKLSKKVIKDVKKDLKNRKTVTSNHIFLSTTKILKRYNKDASFMYKTHRDVS